MFPKNIPLYKLDLTGENPDNKISQEYYRRTDTEHDIAFVMRSGPFYTKSLILTKPDGSVLVEGSDYELLGIASELTAFVKNKEVGMIVLIKNNTITEWFAGYQVVGHFSILNKDLVNMINGAVNDDRPVYYKNIKNKPLWFNPEIHQHDIRYEIHSFADLIWCIKQIRELKNAIPDRNLVSMNQFSTIILSHIEEYERMLIEYIKQHDFEDTPPYTNAHGLTAEQVELELVDNFDTATFLDVLDGFRKDLHVTADFFKRVVDNIGKETESLIKQGTLPILRYGSNSFIPPSINGSYEGMSGNSIFAATNIENNGNALILMNRDGYIVNGLYFMENKTKNIDNDSWNFTGYKYRHQTAVNDGAELTKILSGSNGKFLIVGGETKAHETNWYYALGNGTLNPDSHVLTKLPDEIKESINERSFIVSEMFPHRILLCSTIPEQDVNNLYIDISCSFPPGINSIDELDGVDIHYSGGQRMWEYDISSKRWRKVIFNYSQAYETSVITSEAWIPYKVIIEEVSKDNPRSDGEEFTLHGVRQSNYIFSKLISGWGNRDAYSINLCKYDEDNDRLALKYITTSYGYDTRNSIWEDGVTSVGVIFKNRKVSDDDNSVYYDLENRKGLINPTYMDVTEREGNVKDKLSGEQDHQDIFIREKTYEPANTTWLKEGVMFSISSLVNLVFPLEIAKADFSNVNSFKDFDAFVDGSFENIQIDGYQYNETNPANFTIGQHSTFWTQLDLNDNNTFGSVSYSTEGLFLRVQPALDNSGNVIAPSKDFNIYSTNNDNDEIAYGYELDNTSVKITHPPGEIFCTHVFADIENNRKSEYMKNLIAHHSYPEELTEGKHSVNSETSSFLFKTQWEPQKDGDGYKFVSKVTYDLEEQIKNILIPKLKSAFYVTNEVDTSAMTKAYRIGYTNFAGNKYEQLLIFTAPVVYKSINSLYYAGVAFNLTGGTVSEDGIIKDATVTTIGIVSYCYVSKLNKISFESFIDEKANITFDVSPSLIACRDLVMQRSDGKSMVNMQIPILINNKFNKFITNILFIIDEEDGVIHMDVAKYDKHLRFYEPGDISLFHHPYYGMLSRNYNIDGAELGHPIEYGEYLEIDIDYDKIILGNSNYLDSSFSIYFTAKQEVMINGKSYIIEPTVHDLHDTVQDPRNKIFYIYLDYNGSNAYYKISAAPLAESASRGLIAIAKTNDNSIYEIIRYNVFTMNSFRISSIKHGASIPAATGGIENRGQLEDWVINNRQ